MASAAAKIPSEVQTHPRCDLSSSIWFLQHLPACRRQAYDSNHDRLSAISAKNFRGSTRCAASCGHAYTQLGSFKCVHKSHEVAFCLITAFFRPGCSESSASTSNGCRLMFP